MWEEDGGEWLLRTRNVDRSSPLFDVGDSDLSHPWFLVDKINTSHCCDIESIEFVDGSNGDRRICDDWPSLLDRLVDRDTMLKSLILKCKPPIKHERSPSYVKELETFRRRVEETHLLNWEAITNFDGLKHDYAVIIRPPDKQSLIEMNTTFRHVKSLAFDFGPNRLTDDEIGGFIHGMNLSSIRVRSHQITGSLLREKALAKVEQISISSRRFRFAEFQRRDNSLLSQLWLTCFEDSGQGFSPFENEGITSADISYSAMSRDIALFSNNSLRSFMADGALGCDGFVASIRRDSPLKYLAMRFSDLSDDGLERLTHVAALRQVQLRGCGVSVEGVHRVREVRPDCQWNY